MKKIRFGIKVLDDGLTGAQVMLRSLPGVDSRPFIDQAIRNFAGPVVYLAVDRQPDGIRKHLARVAPKADVTFLDGYNSLVGQPTQGIPVDAMNPAAVVTAIEHAAQDFPKALLVLDGLANIALQNGPHKFAAAWPNLLAASRKFPHAIAVFTDWDAGGEYLHDFGDEISLQGVMDRIITHEYFRVAPAGKESMQPVLYHADGAGVHAYIPKVVVTGPGDAGKTTFISNLCNKIATTERQGTTVAGERGTAILHGLKVELFGTPGQKRFDPLLPTLASQAVAVVLMVDASKQDDFQRASEMLALVRAARRHVLIVANKQDQPGAVPPERIATALGLTDDTPVVGCDARDPEKAAAALSRLLDNVLQTEQVLA